MKFVHAQSAINTGTGAALMGLALLLTGCQSSDGGPATSRSDAGAASPSIAALQADVRQHSQPVTTFPAVQPVTGVNGLRGKTVWYISLGPVPYFSAVGGGVSAALQSAGISVRTCDGKFLPTTMSSCLNQAITQQAAGVIADGVDFKLVPTAYAALEAHHIPVLIADTANDSGKTPSASLAYDDTTPTLSLLAKLDAEAVIVDSKAKAHVLYVGLTDTPQTITVNGFYKEFFRSHCPECTFNEVDFNTASSQKVASLVNAALISHPDTTHLIGEIDTHLPDMISGIRNAGHAATVRVGSALAQVDALQRIKAGESQFVDVGLSQVYLGWQFADGIVRMMLGHTPQNNLGIVRVFTKDNVGDLQLTPTAYATNAWYGPDTFTHTFTEAWGVSQG